MDYETFNKGCLEEAKRLYKTANADQRYILEKLFPELRETEDEKIRKSLLDYLYTLPNHFSHNSGLVTDWIAWLEKQAAPQVRTGIEWVNTIDDACDERYIEEYSHGEYCHEQSFKWGFQEGVEWLEKQGEPKPNPYSGTSFEYNGHTWGMCARDNGVEILFDGELKAFLSLEKSFIYPIHPQPSLIPKSAQETINGAKVEPKFKVGDKIRRKNPSSFDKDMQVARIEKDYYICNHIGKFSSEVVPFSKQSGYELVEQKPAWSEEDELQMQAIIDLLPGLTIRHNWLKSLKDRIQPQPKQEWSEEDSYYRNCIIHIIEEIKNAPLKRKEDWGAYIKWLKSLKDRVQIINLRKI